MLIDKIKAQAKEKNVAIFFDMDGCIVEYGSGERQLILDNAPHFYFNKRPIKTTLRVMKKLSKIKNVTVGICSNCYYSEQKSDKIAWLKIHTPFLKDENIIVITLKDETYTKETKDFIKGKYISNAMSGKDAIVHLMEDDHGIIKSTLKMYPDIQAHHISELLK